MVDDPIVLKPVKPSTPIDIFILHRFQRRARVTSIDTCHFASSKPTQKWKLIIHVRLPLVSQLLLTDSFLVKCVNVPVTAVKLFDYFNTTSNFS